MEIEIPKFKVPVGKRQHRQLSSLHPQAPLKKVIISDQKKTNYHLSNWEKAFIFLQGASGSNPQNIADTINRDKRSIEGFLKNTGSPNPFSPQDHKKGQWPKGEGKLTDRHKKYLRKWANEGSIKSARSAHLRLNSIQNLQSISYHPVRIFLKTLGDFQKPLLKTELTRKNIQKRLNYCLKHRNFYWRKVLFSDESIFQLNSNNQKIFKLKDQKTPSIPKLNPNTKIMVWGGISYSGKTSLHFVNGNMKADQYLKILKAKRREMLQLFRSRKIWYFQQDGAPCHRPNGVKRYIKRWLTHKILPHPAQSPDLNPIELIWAQMKTLVEKKRPQNKQQLSTAILESWNKISIKFIRNCIDNLPKKVEAIIKAEGNLL